MNGNGTIWKPIATGLGGLVIGLLVFIVRDVATQEFVRNHSPYTTDKPLIMKALQDADKRESRVQALEKDIGELNAGMKALLAAFKEK